MFSLKRLSIPVLAAAAIGVVALQVGAELTATHHTVTRDGESTVAHRTVTPAPGAMPGAATMPAAAAIPPAAVTPDPHEILDAAADSYERPPAASLAPPALDPDLREGWPVYLGTPSGGFPYTPTLYDADADGADEIFLTGGHTFGLRGDGTFLPGWPTTEQLYMGYGTNANKPGPSMADLDGDDDTEILWSLRDWWAGSAHMWCFNGKNFDGTDLPGFPQYAPDDMSNALDVPFVLGDVDGDGDLEAWGPHTRGNNFVHYRLSAFDHLGTRLFTVDLNPDEDIISLYFGDLDGDGTKEMFAVSWLDPSLWLHVFEADGSAAPGYPIVLYTFTYGYLPFGPPIPADLDGDGDLEIMFGHWGSGSSRALCCHHDGAACMGFPIEIATSSQLFYLGLGDVTGDGQPELIAFDNHLGGNYRVYVIDLATGTSLPGWPYGLMNWHKGFPTIVDVDNDGLQDICFATDGGDLHAVSGGGQLIDGYPKQMVSPSISGVAAGDIDGDGLFELVAATWDGWVYAWDTPGQVLPGRADWPLRGVNARNTGIFGESGTTSDVMDESHARHQSGLRVEPSLVFFRAEFLFEPTLNPVALEIYDPTGQVVDVLSTGGAHRIAWRPSPLHPSGVYFARLKGQGAPKPVVRFIVLR